MRKKYTLVELLVVISIVSILATLLLPALNKARDNARGISCLANIRQCAQLLSQYEMDNGIVAATILYAGAELSWAELLMGGGYVARNDDVKRRVAHLKCPSWSHKNDSFAPIYGVSSSAFAFEYSNAAADPDRNKYYFPAPGSATFLVNPFIFSRVRTPSKTFLLGDSIRGNSVNYGYQTCIINKGEHAIHLRHGARRANLGYVDGHVAAHGIGDIVADLRADFKFRADSGKITPQEKRQYLCLGAEWVAPAFGAYYYY